MENISILPKQRTNDIFDLEYLREESIKYIQQFAGKHWTDFNPHDPGMTIMEILNYALTEMGYKARYSVKDILARPIGQLNKVKDTLFEASEILTSQPLTLNDYKKILLDIEGVKNARLIPNDKLFDYKGVFSVEVELFPDYDDAFNRNLIKQEILLELNMNRNICEDFYEVKFFEYEDVTLEIDIEVEGNFHTIDLLTDIYANLVEYISPTINFYGLYELLEKNFTVDQIFNGPFLKHGFILDSELENLSLRKELYTSDIIHILMDLQNVEYVKNFRIIDSQGKTHDWACKIKEGKAPRLDIENSRVRLFNLGEVVFSQSSIVFDTNKVYNRIQKHSRHKRLTFLTEQGFYRNLKEYYSIQNDFPEIYGISSNGLPPESTIERKAKAKQLKGYLLFFEQLLANYFSQLENLHLLFSLEPIAETYFQQPLFSVPGIEHLYFPFILQCIENNIDMKDNILVLKEWKKYIEINKKDIENKLATINENEKIFLDRRNRLLNHLLARFAIDIKKYYFYRDFDEERERNFVKSKLLMLENTVEFSKNRGKAFNNIFADLTSETNISGLEFRINMLLGNSTNSRKYPLDFFQKKINVTDILTSKNENPTSFPEIEFENTSADLGTSNLFVFGYDFKNFSIEQNADNKYKVEILNDTNEVIACLSDSYNEKQEAFDAAKIVNTKIVETVENSETFHLLEHILLRPLKEMAYFGFLIFDEKEAPVFRSETYYTYNERLSVIEQIFKLGVNPENFAIVQEGNNQYRIALKNGEDILIKSILYFKENDDFNHFISNLSVHFRNLDSETKKVECIKFFTKYEDSKKLTYNPYSFLMSILIPNWVPRFQDERFKRHLVNIISQELPVHIIPNYLWLNMFELNEILSLYNEYLVITRKRKPDYLKLTKIADQLLEKLRIY